MTRPCPVRVVAALWMIVGLGCSNGGTSIVDGGTVTSTIVYPTERTVFQRQPASNRTPVPIEFTVTVAGLSGYSLAMVDGAGTVVAQKTVNRSATVGTLVSDSLMVPAGGWYQISVRQSSPTGQKLSTVERVGVGDVYLLSGQSNAANHAQSRRAPNDSRVVAYDVVGHHWVPGADPLPYATGTHGSPWPELGDWLVSTRQLPIGFVATAVGGSGIADWQKSGGVDYPRLTTAAAAVARSGFSAVLWDQGETDAVEGMTAAEYASLFRALRQDFAADTGLDVPWWVAPASYFPAAPAANACSNVSDDVRGQSLSFMTAFDDLIAAGDAFRGPTTDVLAGPLWRYPGSEGACVHFAARAQTEVARDWAAALTGDGGATPVCQLTFDRNSYLAGEVITATVWFDESRVPIDGVDGPIRWVEDRWYGSSNDRYDLAAGDLSASLTDGGAVSDDGRAGHAYQLLAPTGAATVRRYVELIGTSLATEPSLLCRTNVATFTVQ